MGSHIGYLIKSINDRVKVHADADLKSHGLTLAQSRVLIFLMNRGGESSQKELEDFLEVSHPTVVGIVSRMEKNGFLTCRFAPDDRRSKLIRLTEKAEKTGQNMDSVINGMENRMLAPLTEQQIAELSAMLESICKNLE